MNLNPKAFFNPTVLLAMALLAIIVMMILPMPSWVLDVGLAASFALAILIFTVTLFIEEPLDFSAFPTILLASLMLRLSLNVSSTKLIIGQGHTGTHAAGNVIQGFANFVMAGSVFLGLVVFGVLLIVNFMVINKGAARMAEVGARFALDGMPGKQLAIDSDVSAGAIDHTQARERRAREQQETTFFGSLDGASKFVKGDAVAGLLITLLNLVMGLIMGLVVHDMPIERAFETYAILTVGDGLVTQIPAVIISIASALLLARGGATGATDTAIFQQLGKHPKALMTVAVLMAAFGLVPGLPFVPFVIGGAILGGLAYLAGKNTKTDVETTELQVNTPHEETMGDILDLDEIHIEFSPDLVNLVLDPGAGLDARIANMRRHVATQFGLVLPEIRLTDAPSLGAGRYCVHIHGVLQAQGYLSPDQILVLLADETGVAPLGQDVQEPVYGAPARWIDASEREEAALAGLTVVSPAEVLATHLLEVIRKNLSRLLSLKALRSLLDEMTTLSDQRRAEANQRLFDELIPDQVPMELAHRVLRMLLDEQVSIRNLPLIFEAIAEARSSHKSAEGICEHVRQRLGYQLIARLRRDDGTVPLIQLSPEWEDRFALHQIDGERRGQDVALPPELFNQLAEGIAEQLQEAGKNGISPALVTSTLRRRFLRTVTMAKGLNLPVLSFDEVGLDAKPSLVGTVAA